MTLPPFAAFWQANRLLEMPEDPANAQFVRFADFRRDPDNHPLKRPAANRIYSARIASYGYADCPGHPMWLAPDEWHGNADAGQVQLLPRIRRTVCIASLTTVRYGSGMRWPDANR